MKLALGLVLLASAACSGRDDAAGAQRAVAEADAAVKQAAMTVAEATVRQLTAPCPGASAVHSVSPVADPPGSPSRLEYPYVAIHGDHVAFYLRSAPGPEDACSSFWKSDRMLFPDGSRPADSSLISCGVDRAAVGYGLPIYRRRGR